MNHDELHREIRTTLARLELCSSATVQAFDSSGGGRSIDEHPGGHRPPGAAHTAADWYRRRLELLDAGRPRRVDSEHGGKTIDTYELLLGDARRELASLTGHTDTAPAVKHHKMQTPEGVKEAAHEDAPGKPADMIARQFGVTEFTARRWYVEWEIGPDDGQPLSTHADSRSESVAELVKRGLSTRDIAKRLGMHQTQVMREIRKAA